MPHLFLSHNIEDGNAWTGWAAPTPAYGAAHWVRTPRRQGEEEIPPCLAPDVYTSHSYHSLPIDKRLLLLLSLSLLLLISKTAHASNENVGESQTAEAAWAPTPPPASGE
eukprot:COSAG01_NODE_6338_length_3728_cov_2.590521_1_plen_110_part_00